MRLNIKLLHHIKYCYFHCIISFQKKSPVRRDAGFKIFDFFELGLCWWDRYETKKPTTVSGYSISLERVAPSDLFTIYEVEKGPYQPRLNAIMSYLLENIHYIIWSLIWIFPETKITLLRHAVALNPLVTVIPTIHGHFKMAKCVVHVEDKIRNKLRGRDFLLIVYRR